MKFGGMLANSETHSLSDVDVGRRYDWWTTYIKIDHKILYCHRIPDSPGKRVDPSPPWPSTIDFENMIYDGNDFFSI